MPDLASMNCVPCRGGVPPLNHDEIAPLHAMLGGDWRVVDDHHIEKEFRFRDFKDALDFTNRVGAIAEEQGPPVGHKSSRSIRPTAATARTDRW